MGDDDEQEINRLEHLVMASEGLKFLKHNDAINQAQRGSDFLKSGHSSLIDRVKLKSKEDKSFSK